MQQKKTQLHKDKQSGFYTTMFKFWVFAVAAAFVFGLLISTAILS